jgi:hypothetical protein
MTGQKTKDSSWFRRSARTRTLVLVLALGVGACRTSTEDIERWANTAQGPHKLVAVLTHDKYPVDLRVEAALSLISMKPRGGRRVGILGTAEQPGLVSSLSQMTPSQRAVIINRLGPRLEAQILKAPAKAQPGQPIPSDPSIPYKDAAHALLVHQGGKLIGDEKLKQRLRAALAVWASSNFAERLDDSSQLYGLEQVVRELKADGVRRLPDLIVPGAPKIDRVADLIAELGDPSTRARASQKLVLVAQKTASEAWLKEKAPGVEAANKASKLAPKPEQFREQLKQYQEEELTRVFSSLRRVGGAPAVDYLLGFAEDRSQAEKKRATALAALQGNLDKGNQTHANRVLAIGGASDTPDSVRDVALQRVGEFPRAMVAEGLYALFKDPNWKVRNVAASLLLKLSHTGQLPEFFDHIGRDSEGMALSEPLRYGALIATLKGAQPVKEVVESHLGTGPAGARLTALGYYYHAGTQADVSRLAPSASDPTKVPECREDAKDCEWKCEIARDGKQETKDIGTVGDFYEFCVKPILESRQPAATSAAPK